MTPEHAALCERLKEAANGVGSLKTGAGDFGLCDQAAAEIERLSGLLDERDLEIAEDDAAMKDLDLQIEGMAAAIERLSAENEALREALKPFATLWDQWDGRDPPHIYRLAWSFNNADLLWGHFKGARTTLKGADQ